MERRNYPVDQGKETRQPTIGQKRASDVAFYLDFLDIVKKGAESQVSLDHSLSREAKKTRTLRLRSELELMQAQTGEQFNSKRPQRVFEGLRPQINTAREKANKKTPNLGTIDRLRLIGRVGRKLTSMTASERSQLFTFAGYKEGEIRDVMIRGAGSGVLNIFTYLAEEHLPTVLGFGEILAAEPFLNADLTDPRTLMWMAVTSGIYYTTMALRIRQTERFLINEDRYIPSASAAATYFLTEKFFEGERQKQRWGIIMGYLANPAEVLKELWWGVPFIPVVGPSVFVAGNVLASSINLGLLGGLEASNWDARNRSKVNRTSLTKKI